MGTGTGRGAKKATGPPGGLGGRPKKYRRPVAIDIGVKSRKKPVKLIRDTDPVALDRTKTQHLIRDKTKSLTLEKTPASVILPMSRITKHLPGGKETFIEYIRLLDSPDPRYHVLLEKWDESSPKEKDRLSLDGLARMADISPGELLGKVAQIAYEHNTDLANFLASVHQPDIVAHTIERAMTDDGFRDRELILKAVGFAPTPQGPNILIQNRLSQQAAAGDGGEKMGLVPFEDKVVEMSPIVRGAVEAELVEEE